MKRTVIAIFMLASISVCVFAQEEFQLQPGTFVKVVNVARANELLCIEDDYTKVLSRFDLESKTDNKKGAVLEDYINYACSQNLNWTEEEIRIMGNIIGSAAKKIAALDLRIKMPVTIEIIKSTMDNEGNAEGYTRRNYIVLKDSRITGNRQSLEDLFIHELFHVLSRYDPEMREKVYSTIGFTKCNEVPYPPEIADKRISNPDAPFNDHYLRVSYENNPLDVMLILYSPKEYDGGSFFAYLQLGMLVVEGEQYNKKAVYRGNKPMILKIKEVKGFYEQIGKNSDYIIHAEELSADHFVMLLNQQKGLPNPELIELMHNALK